MPSTTREAPRGGLELLAPFGTLVALTVPFFALSLASAELTREAKLAAQAAGAVLVLAGIALGVRAESPQPGPRAAARIARWALAACLGLFAASYAAGLLRGRDPYDALPLLPALALVAWGATREGEETSGRALFLLVACGSATGLLAAAQRFTGFLRLSVETPEPRFFATALIGNPGDVGAALVIPALLAAASLARGRRRLAAGLGLAACVLGLSAAATLAPLVAFATGAAILVALDLRRRLVPALVAAVAAVAVLAAAGVLQRAASKLVSGDVATLTTQRDIGVLAAVESIREHPFLGVGPGGFASDFVRARLAAEKRVGRRLVHRSSSSHFDNAHCDPLTVAVEIGTPGALALLAALAALLGGLFGAARRELQTPPSDRVPAEALLASCAAILVLSIANFPIQIVPVSGPFALLAGLSLSRIGGRLVPPARPAARMVLVAFALVLGTASALRFTASLALARAEAGLGKASAAAGAERRDLDTAALADARLAVAIRARHAASHIALGSSLAALGDVPGAVYAMQGSLALQERAETLLNLGRLAVARGDAEAARPFFVRAVWVLPRLAAAIPPAGDPDAVVAETERLEAALRSGGAPPPLPPPLRPR